MLPWPPSANTYWRRNGNRYFISSKGIAYRHATIATCSSFVGIFSKEDRLSLTIIAYPPDRRRRDIDNILKCLCDSLQNADVYDDDSQIDIIHIERGCIFRGVVDLTLRVIG